MKERANHLEEMTPEQRARVIQIAFWAMFAYLEIYVLGGAALDLLAGIAVGIVLAAIVRKHPHFLVIHSGILASMAVALTRDATTTAGLDFALLLSLSVLFVARGNPVILTAVALEHAAGLFLDSWSSLSLMRGSPVIAAYAVARVLACAMVAGILVRQWLRTREPEQPQPVSAQEVPRRPMTAAEWDEQNRR